MSGTVTHSCASSYRASASLSMGRMGLNRQPAGAEATTLQECPMRVPQAYLPAGW